MFSSAVDASSPDAAESVELSAALDAADTQLEVDEDAEDDDLVSNSDLDDIEWQDRPKDWVRRAREESEGWFQWRSSVSSVCSTRRLVALLVVLLVALLVAILLVLLGVVAQIDSMQSFMSSAARSLDSDPAIRLNATATHLVVARDVDAAPTATSTAIISLPRLSDKFAAWREDAKEVGETWWMFEKYDGLESNFAHLPVPKKGWWPADDPKYAVGQFDFDVTHRRFLSAPEAYEKHNTEQKYDPDAFRAADVPILWGDAWGHVHWNAEAERQFYHLFREQQHSSRDIPCHERKYILFPQWVWGGFFSRYREAVQLTMRAMLQTGRELVLDMTRMSIKDTNRDDYLDEGINRYFRPFSECSTSEWLQAQMRPPSKRAWPNWNHIEQAETPEFQSAQIWWLNDERYNDPAWKVPRYHLPYRKHMFEYGQDVKHPQRYKDRPAMLADRTNHPHEHIYPHPTSTAFRKAQWNQYEDTAEVHDRLVLNFYWYMLLMWQYAPLPRIQSSTAMLRQHWSSHLTDKRIGLLQNPAHTRGEYAHALDNSAAMMLRRGDKFIEDSYARIHGYFRDVSLYGWPLMKRAELNKRPFTSLFFMSDDSPLLAETDACVKAPKPAKEPDWKTIQPPNSKNAQMRPSGCRSEAGEWIFSGTPLTWNVYAPQACFDPFLRVGFEQFLVSLHYIVRYSSYAIGHLNSNVGRIMEELMYASRQLDPAVESVHTVYEDGVDDYQGTNSTGY